MQNISLAIAIITLLNRYLTSHISLPLNLHPIPIPEHNTFGQDGIVFSVVLCTEYCMCGIVCVVLCT